MCTIHLLLVPTLMWMLSAQQINSTTINGCLLLQLLLQIGLDIDGIVTDMFNCRKTFQKILISGTTLLKPMISLSRRQISLSLPTFLSNSMLNS